MKRIFFAMLFAALAIASNVSAQEDYNMIIKMPDGTTITLSTSDVEEVTFDNGELVVSGETLKQMLALLADRINRNDDNIAELYSYCSYLESKVYDFASKEDFEFWLSKIYSDMNDYVKHDDIPDYYALVTSLAALNAKVADMGSHEQRITFLETKVPKLFSDLDAISARLQSIERLETPIEYMQIRIMNLEDMIAKQDSIISSLSDEIAALKAALEDLKQQ